MNDKNTPKTEKIWNASVRDFKLQYDKQGIWITFYRGTEIGFDFGLKTEGITTSSIRVLIHDMQ